jgi:saccharopine dehydrogenase-like NADP-dependent oxidoreductase
MIDKNVRYRINITVRAEDGYDKPKVGSLLEANDCVFSVIISNKKWIVLECIIKGKVDYIDSIKRLKEGEDICLIDWAPAVKNIEMSTYTFNTYKGKLTHLLNWEQPISSPL